jgi:hypothetical protein
MDKIKYYFFLTLSSLLTLLLIADSIIFYFKLINIPKNSPFILLYDYRYYIIFVFVALSIIFGLMTYEMIFKKKEIFEIMEENRKIKKFYKDEISKEKR